MFRNRYPFGIAYDEENQKLILTYRDKEGYIDYAFDCAKRKYEEFYSEETWRKHTVSSKVKRKVKKCKHDDTFTKWFDSKKVGHEYCNKCNFSRYVNLYTEGELYEDILSAHKNNELDDIINNQVALNKKINDYIANYGENPLEDI